MGISNYVPVGQVSYAKLLLYLISSLIYTINICINIADSHGLGH